MGRQRVEPSVGPPKETVCFKCRQKGHYKANCNAKVGMHASAVRSVDCTDGSDALAALLKMRCWTLCAFESFSNVVGHCSWRCCCCCAWTLAPSEGRINV